MLISGIEDITMLLRSTLVKSGDKKIRYWKLVENYHTERGTRQRVVAHLGNVRDHARVSGTLEKLKDRFGICSPTVCMDRGMVTEETLRLLRGGYRWIVAESREKAREYACKADAGAWQVMRRDEFGAVPIEVQEIGYDSPSRTVQGDQLRAQSPGTIT